MTVASLSRKSSHAAGILRLMSFVALLSFTASGQSTPAGGAKEPTASISGRVKAEGKPLAGVMVLVTSNNNGWMNAPEARSTTDQDGHFSLTGLAAGRYWLSAFAPALVSAEDPKPFAQLKSITLADGEALAGVDLALVRGGVITGRITGPGGQPAIAEDVRLTQVDEQGKKAPVRGYANPGVYETDDRGIYRIYGLPAGRYLVSAGRGYSGELTIGGGPAYYPPTYHPGVADESRATIVELTPGAEASNVDISLGKRVQAFTVTGRVVDAEADKPIANVSLGLGHLTNEGKSGGAWGQNSSWRADANGEFELDGILPGRYAVFVVDNGDGSSLYGDPVPFEVSDSDVSDIQIKLRRGAVISGTVTIEGTPDPVVLQAMTRVDILATADPGSVSSYNRRSGSPGPDGSFRINGVTPGKVNLRLYNLPKGVSLLRIERAGADVTNGFEVGVGEQVTGVQVLLSYGSSTIRGTVAIEGGILPPGSRVMVGVRRVGSSTNLRTVEVDVRGRFVIEGLADGDYGLALTVYPVPASLQGRSLPSQTVTVSNGSEQEVTMILDLSKQQ